MINAPVIVGPSVGVHVCSVTVYVQSCVRCAHVQCAHRNSRVRFCYFFFSRFAPPSVVPLVNSLRQLHRTNIPRQSYRLVVDLPSTGCMRSSSASQSSHREPTTNFVSGYVHFLIIKSNVCRSRDHGEKKRNIHLFFGSCNVCLCARIRACIFVNVCAYVFVCVCVRVSYVRVCARSRYVFRCPFVLFFSLIRSYHYNDTPPQQLHTPLTDRGTKHGVNFSPFDSRYFASRFPSAFVLTTFSADLIFLYVTR